MKTIVTQTQVNEAINMLDNLVDKLAITQAKVNACVQMLDNLVDRNNTKSVDTIVYDEDCNPDTIIQDTDVELSDEWVIDYTDITFPNIEGLEEYMTKKAPKTTETYVAPATLNGACKELARLAGETYECIGVGKVVGTKKQWGVWFNTQVNIIKEGFGF